MSGQFFWVQLFEKQCGQAIRETTNWIPLVIDNVAAALEDRYPASAFIVIGFVVMVSNP